MLRLFFAEFIPFCGTSKGKIRVRASARIEEHGEKVSVRVSVRIENTEKIRVRVRAEDWHGVGRFFCHICALFSDGLTIAADTLYRWVCISFNLLTLKNTYG